MKAVSGKVVSGLFVIMMVASPALAKRGGQYNGPKYDRINICTPHKMLVQSVADDLDSLATQDFASMIDELVGKKNARIDEISSLENKYTKAMKGVRKLEDRFNRLTNNMQQIVKQLQMQVKQAQNAAKQAQADIEHNQRKKNECRGGLLGTFCRDKYRGRVKKAKKKLVQAQEKKKQVKAQIAGLPAERDSLPAKIARSGEAAAKYAMQLEEVKGMKPTIEQMEKKIAKLEVKYDQQESERDVLKEQLAKAQNAKEKCNHMRVMAKAYPLMFKQAQDFKKNPATCESIDSLMNYARKKFEKIALQDAFEIACAGPNQDGDQGDQDEYDVFEPVVKLDKVISAPMGENGEYENNFRSGDYQPKKVDEVGEAGVTQVKFKVSFDIEEKYDYLLVKDAQGQEVEKLDGYGEKEIVVASSHVQFFFYSDGRIGGKGFTVENIELTKVQ